MSLSVMSSNGISLLSNATTPAVLLITSGDFSSENLPHGRMPVTEQEVVVRTKEFIGELQKRISTKEGNDLRPLNKIFQIITTEQNKTVRDALTKKEGLLTRLFSTQLFSEKSWGEWVEEVVEDRTHFGRVMSRFTDYAQGSIFMEPKWLSD